MLPVSGIGGLIVIVYVSEVASVTGFRLKLDAELVIPVCKMPLGEYRPIFTLPIVFWVTLIVTS